jgi:hypothetical protein
MYPSNYVEFYDHILICCNGVPDDEGPGAVQVGGGAWYSSVRTAFYPNLGNLVEYSSDGTYIIGTDGHHVKKNTSSFGSSFDDVLGDPTPLPAALPLFATGVGALGLLGWRKRRKRIT